MNVMSRSEARVERRRSRPLFARACVPLSAAMERAGAAEHRRRLLRDLAGRVIEVGAGHGPNFAFYPPGVAGVLAVEPEPYLRDLAREGSRTAAVPIEVVDGAAERLPAGDASFDAAVASWVLCSVTDPRVALRELYRVIRPGGELRFLEHVRAGTPGLRRAQRLVDATFWPLLFGGCHTARDTLAEIEAAGFRLLRLERFRFPDEGPTLPASPNVIGTAVKPEESA
jgi:ubiquinone/menaquinone biosynthesis C-methylase UbiE